MKSKDHLPTFRKKKQRKQMLRALAYFSPVLALFFLVTAVYIASYSARTPQEQENIGQEGDTQELLHPDTGTVIHAGQSGTLQIENGQPGEIQTEHSPMLPVDDSTEIYITPRMAYTFEIYDARNDALTSQEEPIPNAMYGLNRSELEQYLTDLAAVENAGLDETQYHYEVRVFSRRAFTVRRTITEKQPEYVIFLIAEDGYLVAYSGDRTEIYEVTHIPLGDFPLEQQAMLTRGIYMKSLTDYYDFLESYSS